MSLPHIAIIGCGTMGQAILGGLLDTGVVVPQQIHASVRHPEKAARLRDRFGIDAGTDNAAAAGAADLALLCVKPQAAHGVLSEPALVTALQGKAIISICAGVRCAQLDAWLHDTAVLRAMPNTPSVIREGMSVVTPGPGATEAHVQTAVEIFSAVGRVRVLEEKHLDAVTGLSGSGPAFVCVIIEALADGGVMMGLPRDVAVELAAQTVVGAGRLVLDSGSHPAALKDQVTTPAGCTIAGLLMMEDRGIRSTLARTIEEATKVAAGLGRAKDA